MGISINLTEIEVPKASAELALIHIKNVVKVLLPAMTDEEKKEWGLLFQSHGDSLDSIIEK